MVAEVGEEGKDFGFLGCGLFFSDWAARAAAIAGTGAVGERRFDDDADADSDSICACSSICFCRGSSRELNGRDSIVGNGTTSVYNSASELVGSLLLSSASVANGSSGGSCSGGGGDGELEKISSRD